MGGQDSRDGFRGDSVCLGRLRRQMTQSRLNDVKAIYHRLQSDGQPVDTGSEGNGIS